jgi:putative glycosyltransferase (TIGR04348 family)
MAQRFKIFSSVPQKIDMKIALVTPAGRGANNGNSNTAQRWARLLRQLGHRVSIQLEWDGADVDLMLALHARRSSFSIERFAAAFPDRPLLVALTGTDLYRDIRTDATAQASLRRATRLIVLQEAGLQELVRNLRAKTDVVYQSARPLARRAPLQRSFEVLVVGHLREEKDPLRAAMALAHLPPTSCIQVSHIGGPLDADLARQATALSGKEQRYRWLGERPHAQVRRYLARAKLLVISSRMEGGANVVSEALAAGCPVLASDISGNIGMLGRDYAGYFTLSDERDLARLLSRAENDRGFYRRLAAQCRARRALMTATKERASLAGSIAAACAMLQPC